MQDSLRKLRALQELDNELRALRSKADELPKRIARLRDEATRVREEFQATEAALIEHRKQYKLADLDLKSADERVSHYSVQLYSAKTNEQYKAFLKEIDAQKRLKSQIEDRMIALLEAAEALEVKRKAAEKSATQSAAENDRKIEVLEEERVELEAATSERVARRDGVLFSLPADLLRLYRRVADRKHGIAVVSVTGERCNGCYNPIPPQRMVEIERRDRVYTCEACGRIVIPNTD